MILNEDYFDNIDITDDDLKSGETGLYTDVNKDTTTLIKDMFSSYKQCLCLKFAIPFDENRPSQNFDVWNLFDKTNKWNLFRNTIRRVYNVFDAYGIKYSEPFFCTKLDWYEISNDSNVDWDIINIENNKVLVKSVYDIKLYKHMPTSNGLNIFMFIDLPVFNSAKSAYRFLYRFANSLQNMIQNNDKNMVVVYHLNKNNQGQYVYDDSNGDNIKILLNDVRINFFIKSIMLRYIKDDILYLLPPQYKHRMEFEKAQLDYQLQALIKNY